MYYGTYLDGKKLICTTHYGITKRQKYALIVESTWREMDMGRPTAALMH